MKITDLDFKFPLELVATEPRPRGESRIFFIPKKSCQFVEKSWDDFFQLFNSGDLLVLNNTKVLKARLIMGNKEVFFLKTLSGPKHWQVLTKGLKGKTGKAITLPGDVQARILVPGKPAEIEILDDIDNEEYLSRYGHVPLPPYILALRENHEDNLEDITRYQTTWAEKLGSVAAPTASLHFEESHLLRLKKMGIQISFITLHVGGGTFFPIDTDNVRDYKIHSESVAITKETAEAIIKTKASGGKIWACGTTVARALESSGGEEFTGETDLFITPGFEFKVVDGLLTNFHQPASSLVLLAASFAGQGLMEDAALAKIKTAYQAAIEKKFRLFSYGDLTVIA